MFVNLLSLVFLVPLACFMLLQRIFMCLLNLINTIFVSLIPSPISPLMCWTRIINPSNGYHVDKNGSLYIDVYSFSIDGEKYSSEEMERIRQGFGTLILIILSITWYNNIICIGLLLSFFMYFISCTQFMKPGEYWTPSTGLCKKD